MKLITNKYIRKTLIAFIVCIMIINLIVPTRAYAWDVGGVLFKPITWLATTVIRAFNSILGIILRRR